MGGGSLLVTFFNSSILYKEAGLSRIGRWMFDAYVKTCHAMVVGENEVLWTLFEGDLPEGEMWQLRYRGPQDLFLLNLLNHLTSEGGLMLFNERRNGTGLVYVTSQ